MLNIARPTGFIPNVSDAFAILTLHQPQRHLRHRDPFGCAPGTRGAAAGPRTFTPADNATNLTLNVT
jgi:hypothetical protein